MKEKCFLHKLFSELINDEVLKITLIGRASYNAILEKRKWFSKKHFMIMIYADLCDFLTLIYS